MTVKKKATGGKDTSKKVAGKTATKSAGSTKGAPVKSADMTSLVDLTPEAVKLLPKPREGFEAHIEPMLALYEDNEAELGTLKIQPAEIRARFQRYQDLGPEEAHAQQLADAATKHLEMVRETRQLQASTIWQGQLEIYGKGKSSKSPEIKAGIAAFANLLAIGPRPPKTPPSK